MKSCDKKISQIFPIFGYLDINAILENLLIYTDITDSEGRSILQISLHYL